MAHPAREQQKPDGPAAKQVIGASARELDDRPVRDRLRLDPGSTGKLAWMIGGYLALIALSIWLIHEPTRGQPVAMTWFIPVVVVLAFAFETMDSAAGMGFGTALAPLLLAMGYDPLAVVPVLLISEAVTGFISAAVHHEFRNVRFSLKNGANEATRLMLLIAGVGVVSIIGSVVLTYLAIELSDLVIKTYVAVLVLVMGCVAIVRRFAHRKAAYRPKRMIGFAALAGINKGIGGGGYGPVVTLGAIYSGVYEKSAAAITSLAEGVVSLAGIAAFFAISAVGVNLDFALLPSVLAGSALAAVISPYLVRILPNRIFSYVIPVYAAVVGVIVLVKLSLSAFG